MSETVAVLTLAAAFVVAGFIAFYRGSKPGPYECEECGDEVPAGTQCTFRVEKDGEVLEDSRLCRECFATRWKQMFEEDNS